MVSQWLLLRGGTLPSRPTPWCLHIARWVDVHTRFAGGDCSSEVSITRIMKNLLIQLEDL